MRRIAAGLLIAIVAAGFMRETRSANAQDSTAIAAAIRAIDAATAEVVPAMVVAITDRTRTLAVIAHGYADVKTRRPVTADSLFAVGSMSKSFTAMALMELFDEGRFDPLKPVTNYLSWFKVHSTPGPITGHHLLSHTAGLPNYRADLASSELATYALRDWDVPYPPGSHYWYSNLGFQTLGYLLERIDRATYPSIIERRILSRIGMPATKAVINDALRTRLPVSYAYLPGNDDLVEQPWFEYSAADGSIASNGADMAAYVRVILNRGALSSGRLLSERAFNLMTTPVLNDYAYGLRVRHVDGDTVIGHSGSIAGFNSVMEAHMNDGFGIVLMTNGRPSQELGRWILSAVKTAMRNEPLPPAPVSHAETYVANARALAGVYRSPTGDAVEFVDAGDALSLKRGAAMVSLRQIGEDTFLAPAADLIAFPFVFERKDGTVIAVSHGSDWYMSRGYDGPKEFHPRPEYAAYAGRYENHNPEGSVIRIFVNRDRLMAADGIAAGQPLVSVGPGLFKPATPEFNPERYHFDSIVDGHALRLTVSGMPMFRIEDR